MKKLFLLTAVLVLSFIFLGCPYKSKVAIDNFAKTKIDKRITGYWIQKDTANPDAEVTAYFSIKDRNGFILDIEKFEFTDTTAVEDEETEGDYENMDTTLKIEYNDETVKERSGKFDVSATYEAFFSEIDGMMFLNLRQVDDFSGFGYYLYKITFKGKNEFYISPLTEYIKTTFEKSDALRNFISKYKDLEFFYGDNEYYIKYDLPK